jgi:hypothetical protein
MAQLIKLQDYISRYETDIFRYCSQFTRLKKQRWDAVKHSAPVNWSGHSASFQQNSAEPEKKSFLLTLKKWLKKGQPSVDKQEEDFFPYESNGSSPSLKQLKNSFFEDLYEFQLRWASSTISDESFLNKRYYQDDNLRFFLQSLPDNFLVLYHPVFIVKHAPVEGDIILLSPTATWCISILHGKGNEVFRAETGRFWAEGYGTDEHKHINPTISLNRTSQIVESIYRKNGIDLPVKKIILSKSGIIENSSTPNMECIDATQFEQWHNKMKRLPSPIKLVQLKGARCLMNHCQSTYVQRQERQHVDDEFS